jgi:hypothetical protein
MTTIPKKPATSLFGVVWVYLLLALIVFYGASFLLMVSGLPKMNAWLFFQSRILIWISLILLYLFATRVEKQYATADFHRADSRRNGRIDQSPRDICCSQPTPFAGF